MMLQKIGCRPPEASVLILGAALPEISPAGLRDLCLRWEGALAPWLAPEQMRHIRRFAPQGAALQARASRLLARLLLLRGMATQNSGPLCPAPALHQDMAGRPQLSGWAVSFSHSGRAAFCALEKLTHQRQPTEIDANQNLNPNPPLLGLDAECLGSPPPAARAFAAGSAEMSTDGTEKRKQRDALRRWTIKEAALKALGKGLGLDPALIHSGGHSQRAGRVHVAGKELHWRLLACPGHWICLARDSTRPPAVLKLRWVSAWLAAGGPADNPLW